MAQAKQDTTENEIVNETTGELETYTGGGNPSAAIAGLNDPGASIYSSIKGDDVATRLKIAAAVTTSEPIADHLGEVFNLANYIAQVVTIGQPDGTVVDAARVTLITDEGIAYSGTSAGLLTFIRTINGVMGEPSTWDGAVIPVKVVRERSRNGFFFFNVQMV